MSSGFLLPPPTIIVGMGREKLSRLVAEAIPPTAATQTVSKRLILLSIASATPIAIPTPISEDKTFAIVTP